MIDRYCRENTTVALTWVIGAKRGTAFAAPPSMIGPLGASPTGMGWATTILAIILMGILVVLIAVIVVLRVIIVGVTRMSR